MLKDAEGAVHRALSSYRYNKKREFFVADLNTIHREMEKIGLSWLSETVSPSIPASSSHSIAANVAHSTDEVVRRWMIDNFMLSEDENNVVKLVDMWNAFSSAHKNVVTRDRFYAIAKEIDPFKKLYRDRAHKNNLRAHFISLKKISA